MPTDSRPKAAFYCVSDERYFLGAVGLINSLRLVGHTEPIHLLDCGLAPWQRELVEPHALISRGPQDSPPWLAKTIAPRRHPADVMVLIDTDMVATRSLAPLLRQAAPGRIVAIQDPQQRFFAEWGVLLELGTARPRRYVSSGLVCVERSIGSEVLGLMDDRRGVVDFERTFWRRNDREYPFLYADQDVLNGILASAIEPGRSVALDHRLAATPPYRDLRVRDAVALRCAYADGVEPFLLHQYVRKPWLERTYHGIYSRLLTRLLLGPDVVLKVPDELVPLRMRRGLQARAERAGVNALDFVRWRYGDRVPTPIAPRVEALRRRLRRRGAR
jgi:hypothetical protein